MVDLAITKINAPHVLVVHGYAVRLQLVPACTCTHLRHTSGSASAQHQHRLSLRAFLSESDKEDALTTMVDDVTNIHPGWQCWQTSRVPTDCPSQQCPSLQKGCCTDWFSVKVVGVQMVALIQQVALAHQVHYNSVGLTHVAVDREVFSRIQFDMQHIATLSIA